MFPSFCVFCRSDPSIGVLQVAPSCFFGFVNLDESVDVILPYFLWPSFYPACFCFNLESRLPFCCFFVHLDSEREAILIANLHFIFLCNSIQHGMLAARILSSASPVLLLIYSIHSSAVSTSSSVSFVRVCCCILLASFIVRHFFVVRQCFVVAVPSLCLNDESEHLALRRTSQFLVFL